MDNHAEDASADIGRRLQAYAMLKKAEGRLPFEGRWLTVAELEEEIRRIRAGSWVKAIEILLVFGLLNLFSALAVFVVWRLGY